MAEDAGKDLGYHWRRSAGIYDAPDHEGPPGNANTLSSDLIGGEPAEDLGSLTKSELITKAQDLGISPANAAMSKAELVAAIQAGPTEEG
jgi:hypothetical protein